VTTLIKGGHSGVVHVVTVLAVLPIRQGAAQQVSREYLHRYLWQFDFLWNNRQMNDGERTIAAIKAAEGKRLMYKDPVAEQAYIRNRGQEKGGEQLEPF